MAEMWYYTSEGKQMEPVTTAELKQLAASGMLKPTDMVWKEGMPKWRPAAELTDCNARPQIFHRWTGSTAHRVELINIAGLDETYGSQCLNHDVRNADHPVTIEVPDGHGDRSPAGGKDCEGAL